MSFNCSSAVTLALYGTGRVQDRECTLGPAALCFSAPGSATTKSRAGLLFSVFFGSGCPTPSLPSSPSFLAKTRFPRETPACSPIFMHTCQSTDITGVMGANGCGSILLDAASPACSPFSPHHRQIPIGGQDCSAIRYPM